MKNKESLLVVNDFHPPTIARLDQIYQTHKLWQVDSAEQQHFLQSIAADCRAAACASWHCEPAVYSMPQLQVISCFGVGVDGIDFKATNLGGITVTNTPDVLNDTVADIALGLVLATARKLVNADAFVRQGQWLKKAFPMGMSLTGKTLGIIGLGRIGEAIAQRALSFNLNIAYHNRSSKAVPHRYCASLEELAQISDILVNVLPGGKLTEDIINADVFEALGPQGIFINVGRGSSVDQAALIHALSQNTIAGAGLDVYAKEPQVPAALLNLHNVVLLPHIGSGTNETRQAMGQLVIDNLHAYFNGKPLLSPVEA